MTVEFGYRRLLETARFCHDDPWLLSFTLALHTHSKTFLFDMSPNIAMMSFFIFKMKTKKKQREYKYTN